MTKAFTEVTGALLTKSLVRKLQPVADSVRDLAVRFGLRPYKVTIVRVRWSGGERGSGIDEVISETPVLPVPVVADMTGMQYTVEASGVSEQGSLFISEISGRYTEEELLGLAADGSPVAEDEDVYWEVEFPRTDGRPSNRRRFNVAAAPSYNAGKLGWAVVLVRDQSDRLRDGNIA